VVEVRYFICSLFEHAVITM